MDNKITAYEDRLIQDRKLLNNLIEEVQSKDATRMTQMRIEQMQRELAYMNQQLILLKEENARVPQMQQTPPVMQQAAPQQAWQPMQQTPPTMQSMPQMQQTPPTMMWNANAAPVAPQRDIEQTIGKSLMGIFASILIFFSLLFFAAVALPFLNDTIKMILMYVISLGFAITGNLLLIKDKKNKWFLSIAGCGMGAVYISLFVSNLYFKTINDIVLYLCVFVWAVVVCILSRLRSDLFLSIGQAGVAISVFAGVVLCNKVEDVNKLLFLFIYFIVTEAVFYISHLNREYNKNLLNHIFMAVCLVLLLFAVNADYTEATIQGGIISILFAMAALALIVLSMVAFRISPKENAAFGVLNSIYFFTAYSALSSQFENAEIAVLPLAILALIGLEIRFYEKFLQTGSKIAGKLIFQIMLFIYTWSAACDIHILEEYISVMLLLAVGCFLYGYLGNKLSYKIAGIVYGSIFIISSMNDYLHFIWGLGLFTAIFVLQYSYKEQYRNWMKVISCVMLYIFLMADISRILGKIEMMPTDGEDLIYLVVIGTINAALSKVPALYHNPLTKAKEEGTLIMSGIVQMILMLFVTMIMIFTDSSITRILAVFLAICLYAVNSYSLLKIGTGGGGGIYVAIKFTFLAMVICAVYSAPGFLGSMICLVIAVTCTILGFAFGRQNGMNLKPVRIYGLILALICLVKLILFDISYDSMLLRAVSFFVSGLLCFGISFIYNLADKKLMRQQKNNYR